MNICRAIISGNLTRDPDLKQVGDPSNPLDVCQLRVAVNTRRKVNGEWTEKPNYFDVVVWGGQARACGEHLKKGRPVNVDGRLDWREWEHEGQKRQAISIIADAVQFLGSPSAQPPAPGSEPGDSIPGADDESRARAGQQTSAVPATGQDFGATSSGFEPSSGDEDIPF